MQPSNKKLNLQRFLTIFIRIGSMLKNKDIDLDIEGSKYFHQVANCILSTCDNNLCTSYNEINSFWKKGGRKRKGSKVRS